MTGYSKLFGSIVTSTIWREDKETKILWITMLALKDKNGIVEGSVPGLADMARLTIDETVSSLDKLKAPDEYSRSQEHGGRRIEVVDGGWIILNHKKYRDKMNSDERREYLRVKQAEHRQRTVNKRQQKSTPSTDTDTDTDKSTPQPPKGGDVSDGFDSFWTEYPNKQAKISAKRAWLKIKPDELEEVMRGLAAWKQSQSWLKDDGQFIPHPATFLNQRRWEDSPKAAKQKQQPKYNHLPPARIPTDAEFKNVAEIARRETEALREKFKAGIK